MDEGIWICAFCAEENQVDATWCEACGKGRDAVPPPPASDAPSGPRRFVQRLVKPRPAPEAEPERPHRAKRRLDDEVRREGKKVRMRFIHLSARLKGALNAQNYKEVLSDRSNPVTTMLIAFVAWGIFRMVGFVPLMILLRALAFLAGPFGLVAVLAVAFVYSQHHEEIDARVGRMRARARSFRKAASDAARSIAWLRDRLRILSRGGEVPGSAVKVTDEVEERNP